MATGTVKFFNAEKGWGFIAPDEGGDELFVHYSSIQSNGFRTLEQGQKVEFSSEKTDRGMQAKDVKLLPLGIRCVGYADQRLCPNRYPTERTV